MGYVPDVMRKNVYDANENQKVDSAEDADTVDGADAGVAANNVFKIPSDISEGDIFYVDASGNVVRLAAGTSGHFLKTQGANNPPVWAAVPEGVENWVQLNDTPSSISANKFVSGNSTGDALEFAKDVPSGSVVGTTDEQTLENKTLKTSKIYEKLTFYNPSGPDLLLKHAIDKLQVRDSGDTDFEHFEVGKLTAHDRFLLERDTECEVKLEHTTDTDKRWIIRRNEKRLQFIYNPATGEDVAGEFDENGDIYMHAHEIRDVDLISPAGIQKFIGGSANPWERVYSKQAWFNQISELDTDNGVTIDGCLIKDGKAEKAISVTGIVKQRLTINAGESFTINSGECMTVILPPGEEFTINGSLTIQDGGRFILFGL